MRKLFWLAIFLGGYLWMVLTGNEHFVLEKGRALYNLVTEWLGDADLDFQYQDPKQVKPKQPRTRRWE